ncbi:OLC1v1032278C3 [Oldenlandia corymbosa var. corymbosa]|nr:OLC1v1032278C3 [Oldenlandia corymbosa var. corymbosa]
MGHRLTVNQLRIKSQHKVTTWDRLMAKRGCLDQWITVAVMLLVDFAFAVVNVLYKKALNDGMSNLLLIFYRQCVSAIFLAPIAYIWERKSWENLTVGIVCGLFLSALLGATLCQYFFLIGLGYTSATYTCAFINVVPVVTFILALWLRQEKLNLKNRSGRAKLLGAIVCVGGVLLLILYKGVAVINAIKTAAVTTQSDKKRAKDWVVGSIFLFVGSTMWSSWFVIQAQIGKYFAFQYSSTTIISFFATIQSAILCLIVDRNMSSWLPKGITQITTVIYAGIVGSGICYVALAWCVKKRGAVFTSAFGPFIQVFVAFFDVFLLHEQINLGSILGSLVVVVGMYMLLWGKSKEVDCQKSVEADGGKDNGDFNLTLPVTKPAAIVSSTDTASP